MYRNESLSTDNLIEHMQEYIKRLDALPPDRAAKESARQLLKAGLLDENGKMKTDIVTGEFFGW